MKKVGLLLGLAMLQACADRETDAVIPEVNVLTGGDLALVDAWLTNDLPADGCDLHFRIGEGDAAGFFVASEGSLRKVSDYYQRQRRDQASIPVKIAYIPTGITRKIRCGWGNESEYPAIEVVVIN